MIRLHNTSRTDSDTAAFFADAESDIALLPTTTAKNSWSSTVPFGSSCILVDGDGSVFRLDSTDKWVKQAGGGSGGGGGSDFKIATDEEVQNMLDEIFN